MDTGRCRIADLPGMGEGLKLRWFTEDWLLVQGNGEILSDDFAQLINMSTREVLRIRPGMFGSEKMQHIGVLTDGTVVIVTRRNGVGPVFRYPTDFWGFLRTANKPRRLEPGGSMQKLIRICPSSSQGRNPNCHRSVQTTGWTWEKCCFVPSLTSSPLRKDKLSWSSFQSSTTWILCG